MSWCDIGVNFTDKRLSFDPVFERALAANVQQMIITGTSLEKSQQAEKLASQYPNQLFSTAGVHPHDASSFDQQTFSQLKALAQSNQIVAIGECGLDFNRNFSTPKQQLYAFEQQLILACELGLPVFLHERDAFDAQIQLLTQYRKDLVGGVAHCFTGNLEQANKALNYGGFKLGLGGVLTFKNSGLDKVVDQLDMQHFVLETDSPYLAPTPNRGKRNESSFLLHIAEKLADVKGIPLKTVGEITTKNAIELFNLD